jgi:hypothetical protein
MASSSGCHFFVPLPVFFSFSWASCGGGVFGMATRKHAITQGDKVCV